MFKVPWAKHKANVKLLQLFVSVQHQPCIIETYKGVSKIPVHKDKGGASKYTCSFFDDIAWDFSEEANTFLRWKCCKRVICLSRLQVWTIGSSRMNPRIHWPLFNQCWPVRMCCPSPNLPIVCLCPAVVGPRCPPVQSTQYGCRRCSGKGTPSCWRDPLRATKTTYTLTTLVPNTWTGWPLATLSASWITSPSLLMHLKT